LHYEEKIREKKDMSPQDKVERVLKEMHLTFSKCETYNGHPDKIIVDRKEFLKLLDRLNQGIYDMMEQYEQTRQSRENAERAFRKKGDEIIEVANANAEDVYAASVIYTADMLGRIRDLMDQTNESMNDLFREFRKDLREQKDLVKTHETELQSQLADMVDTKKYLSIIQDMNRTRERKARDLKAEKEAGVRYAKNITHTPASGAEVKVNELYFEKAGKPVPDEAYEREMPAEKPDILIHTDSPYFKWKESQEKKEHQGAATEEVTDAQTDRFAEGDSRFAQADELTLEADDSIADEGGSFSEMNDYFDDSDGRRNSRNAGKILKDLIFGKED
jgi:hypothetical protein